jgi:phage I-like protein
MTQLTAFCAETELPDTGTAPQWVHLLPGGMIQGRDGRRFVLDDPSGVIAASSDGADLPIDYEHQADDPKARLAPGGIKAAGWIKRLELRADGIWGLVEWTETARNMIEAREYRYLSPVFNHFEDGKIIKLLGAGLVHRPNLALKALSSQQGAMTERATLARIALALGLSEAADVGTILTAVNSLKAPDPARYVPVEALADLLKERHQTKAMMSQQAAEAKVEKACGEGYITPAMRSWALSLCRQDPASFDAFLASSAPTWGHLFRPAVNRVLDRGIAEDEATAAGQIAAQLGIDAKRLG